MARAGSVAPDGRSAARREQIIAAAEACFDELGVARTTMEDVARKAGLSRATTYRYFSTREALLTEIVQLRSRELLERGVAMLAQAPDLTTSLESAMVYAMAEFPRDPRIRELMSIDPYTAISTESLVELARSVLRPWLTRHQARGDLRTDLDLDEILHWLITQGLLIFRSGKTSEDDVRHEVRAFLVPALRAQHTPNDRQLGRTTLRDVVDRLERVENSVGLLVDALAKLEATLES